MLVEQSAFCWLILQDYIAMHGAKNKLCAIYWSISNEFHNPVALTMFSYLMSVCNYYGVVKWKPLVQGKVVSLPWLLMKMFLKLHTLNLAISGGKWWTSNCFATGERDRIDTRVGLDLAVNWMSPLSGIRCCPALSTFTTIAAVEPLEDEIVAKTQSIPRSKHSIPRL